MARLTLHLVPAETWDGRDPATPYLPAAYAEDGFVHCTDGDRAMIEVANSVYAGDPRPFLLLTLDLERTGSPWRFDDPNGATRTSTVRSTVVGRRVRRLVRDPHGRFTAITPPDRRPGGSVQPVPSDGPALRRRRRSSRAGARRRAPAGRGSA
jgi:hypothetical protein